MQFVITIKFNFFLVERPADNVHQHPVVGGAEGLLPQLQDHREHISHAGLTAVRSRHCCHHVDYGPCQPEQLPDLAAGAHLHALPVQLLHGGGQHVHQVQDRSG